MERRGEPPARVLGADRFDIHVPKEGRQPGPAGAAASRQRHRFPVGRTAPEEGRRERLEAPLVRGGRPAPDAGLHLADDPRGDGARRCLVHAVRMSDDPEEPPAAAPEGDGVDGAPVRMPGAGFRSSNDKSLWIPELIGQPTSLDADMPCRLSLARAPIIDYTPPPAPREVTVSVGNPPFPSSGVSACSSPGLRSTPGIFIPRKSTFSSGLGINSVNKNRCLSTPMRRGCSSGVEHNLAKVGVEGSNPFTRSSLSIQGPADTDGIQMNGYRCWAFSLIRPEDSRRSSRSFRTSPPRQSSP